MRQINIRIPEESRTVLEAGAFLNGVKLATLVRDTLAMAMHKRAQAYREGISSGTLEPTDDITDFLHKYDTAFPTEDLLEPEE
jgi:hypothetical protein